MPTIYSVGYQKLTPAGLAELVRGLGAVLIDVRSHPAGRVRRGFGKSDLQALLGPLYEWHGKALGGKGKGVTAAGLDMLAADPRRLLLMCMEHAPGECHRHHTIAVPLLARGVVVRHVYEDQVVAADELQRAIDRDDDYEFTSLADLLEQEGRK